MLWQHGEKRGIWFGESDILVVRFVLRSPVDCENLLLLQWLQYRAVIELLSLQEDAEVSGFNLVFFHFASHFQYHPSDA